MLDRDEVSLLAAKGRASKSAIKTIIVASD
jgi:hypothetical protein